MDHPLVSVLMTAYNREKYIAEAIESVLASTYTNFELIIVDDCSKDRTAEIALSYKQKDDRVKVYVNEKNLGDYPNRNKAASHAEGKYLKYLDSDDAIYTWGLEAMVYCMEKNPEAGLGVSSQTTQKVTPFPLLLNPAEAYTHHFFKEGILNCGPSGVIIQHEAFKQAGGFSGKRMVGDVELWLKLSAVSFVAILPPSLIYWRQHNEQEFFTGIQTTMYLEMNFFMIKDAVNSTNCPLSINERSKIINYHKRQAARALLSRAIKKKEFNNCYLLFKKMNLTSKDILHSFFKKAL